MRHRTGGVWRTLGWGAAVAVPLAFLAIFFVWPVLALVLEGLGPVEGEGFDLSGVGAVLAEQRTWQVTSQTLIQAALGTVLSVALGLPAAYALFRLRFRGQGALRALLTVPFVLPTVVVAVAFTALLREGGIFGFLGMDESLLAVVVALAFFNVTIVARTVGGFWSGLDSRPEQAARVLGASSARAFTTITLPRLIPAIASASSLVFLFCATSFGVVLILGGRRYANLETEVYHSTILFFDLHTAAVLSMVQIVLVLLVLWVSARLRRRADQQGNVERRAQVSDPLTRSRWPIVGFVLLTMALLHALPLGALVLRSLSDGRGGLTLQHYAALADPPAGTGLNVTVFQAAGLSLRSAAVATVLAIVLGALIVLVLSRRPRSRAPRGAQSVLDAVVMLPLGVSAVTLGFGLLLTMRNPLWLGVDLRTSAVLIPVAQAIIALPLVIRSLLPAARAISQRQRDAAALLGAGPGRVLATIDLPILARPAGLAVGFAFAVSLGEFGATSFLVRPEMQTLPVMIARLIDRQGEHNFEMGLAASVLLGLVTALVMLGAERMRGREVVAQW